VNFDISCEDPVAIVTFNQIKIAASTRISENLNSKCTDCQPKPEWLLLQRV